MYDPFVTAPGGVSYVESAALSTYRTVINSAMFEHVLTREDLDDVNRLVAPGGVSKLTGEVTLSADLHCCCRLLRYPQRSRDLRTASARRQYSAAWRNSPRQPRGDRLGWRLRLAATADAAQAQIVFCEFPGPERHQRGHEMRLVLLGNAGHQVRFHSLRGAAGHAVLGIAQQCQYREQAQQLLMALMPDAGSAMHIGITGVPGDVLSLAAGIWVLVLWLLMP